MASLFGHSEGQEMSVTSGRRLARAMPGEGIQRYTRSGASGRVARGARRWAGVAGYALVLAVSLAALLLLIGPPQAVTFPSHAPSAFAFEVWLQSSGAPLDGAATLARDAAWLVWTWATTSLLIEILLAVAETGPARGARWVRAVRALADRAALPLARHVVAASLSVQVGLRAVGPVLGVLPPPMVAYAATTSPVDRQATSVPAAAAETPAPAEDADTYVVRAGDSLWSISEQVYGSGHEYPLLIAANSGRRMSDGRLFDNRGVIHPGWVLSVPPPNQDVGHADNGRRMYVVRHGDCLSGIAYRLLGDSARWPELFELNRGATTPDGRQLTSPSLIWPGLVLELPPDTTGDTAQQDSPDDANLPMPGGGDETAEPRAPDVGVPPAPVATAAPTATLTDPQPTAAADATAVLTTPPPTVEEATPPPAVALEPVAPPSTSSPRPLPEALTVAEGLGALVVGGGLVGVGLARRRRSLPPLPVLPESDIKVEEGFADADPGRGLADHLPGRRLAEQDPVMLLVAHLMRILHEHGGDALARGTRVAMARHGRSSTTLELTAPIAEQQQLLTLAPGVASPLGRAVEAETELTPDGDVALRLHGLRRAGLQPARMGTGESALPTMVPIGVLADRQELSANWDMLGHVLVSSPVGGGAPVVLTSLLAHLAARRRPAQLQVRTIASPRDLPRALLALPHHYGPTVDPLDQEAVAAVLSEVRAELDRRLLAESSADWPDLVLVVAELMELVPYIGLLGQLGEQGAACGVRLLAASTRPGVEVASHPLLTDFATRLVQRTADEDESVALLGTADAAYLGGGGRLLFRFEHRAPVELYAYRVGSADLDRLVEVMRTAYGNAGDRGVRPAPSEPASRTVITSTDSQQGDAHIDHESSEEAPNEDEGEETVTTTADDSVDAEVVASTEEVDGCGDLLPPESAALLEVQCFGGPRVLRGGDELWPSREAGREVKPFQLLLFLAAHSADGVDRDRAAVALLAEDESVDPATTLRQWRHRVRSFLGRLVPDLPADPFEDAGRICRLNPEIVRSDVQRFLALERWAKSRACLNPEAAYEGMRALYVGDLFGRSAAQPYPWAVGPRADGTSLAQEYRQLYQDATRVLAERYAATTDDPGRAERALELYEELTRLDPTNERLWCALFRLHTQMGDRATLERDWRRLCQTLDEIEPGTKPRVTTTDLYQQSLRALAAQPSAPALTRA